jgi:hypothetical protein
MFIQTLSHVAARAKADFLVMTNATRGARAAQTTARHRSTTQVRRRIVDKLAHRRGKPDSSPRTWTEVVATYGLPGLALLLGVLGVISVGQ